MDLMNKELLTVRLDVEAYPFAIFKQDQKLVAAINKLYIHVCDRNSNHLLLPGRKLDFVEVQQLLKETGAEKELTSESSLQLKCVHDEKNNVIKKIEDILGIINETAGTSLPPKLILRNQRLWSNCIYDLDRSIYEAIVLKLILHIAAFHKNTTLLNPLLEFSHNFLFYPRTDPFSGIKRVTLKAFNDAKKTTVVYSNSGDRSRFNAIVFVLSKVHELLIKSLTVTRRFHNQCNLDVAVRDVCCLLETPPWNLGIVATAKGLVAGPLLIKCRDGSTIDCMTTGGTLLPQDINGIQEFKSSAKYILVVEKDAIFQKLLDEGALIRLGPVIILTGKGYPDVCTRQLLCRLVKELRVKALALVDYDPHGYEIFLTYKYGSLAQSHLSSSLACSTLLLLGIRHSDVMTLVPHEARLILTAFDKRKLGSLMRRPYLNNPIGLCIKEELQAMLNSGVKAEIEAVAPTAAALCDSYIPSKLIQADYLG